MKIIKCLLKCIFAGITAMIVLCAVFAVYTFLPVHSINAKGNTDYIWPANAKWFQMTEGISQGKFDANGYNNMQVIENPDILILGSSHMEAVNVQQDETVTYLLNQKFAGDYTAYNLGMSSHNLIKVCKYLPVTIQLYEEAPEFIVIETSQTLIQQSDVDSLLNGTVEFTPSHDTGLIASLQKLPFFRLVYRQLDGGLLDLFMPAKNAETETSAAKSVQVTEEAYDALFEYIGNIMNSSSSRLIIFYHPTETLQEDGSVVFNVDEESNALFAKKCEEYGIIFLDMTQPFTDMYNTSHKLPHGFITGEIGTGHLNAAGHEIVAQELADTIDKLRRAE